MFKIKQIQLTGLIIFLVIFSACTYFQSETAVEPENVAKPQTAAAPDTADQTATDEPAAADAGLCENKYYPLQADSGRAYQITGGAPASYVLTQDRSGEDSFGETRQFASGTSVKTNWVCTAEGLRSVEYNSGVDFSSGNFKMETLESSGLTLPKTWETGKKWKAEYKISGKLKAGPVNTGVTGTVTVDNEIAALDDTVTTAAGEFKAAKVVSTINLKLSVGPPTKVTTTNWYAPDIGLVKQETASPFGGKQNVEYTGTKDSPK
jgi:hypothetical protein